MIMMMAQASLTSRLSTSNSQYQYQDHHTVILLTEQLESGESGDCQGDGGTDDQHAVLVTNTVVYQAPDYPAGSVTDVAKNSNVGVETVRGYQEQSVRLLPVDQKALGDAD